MFEQDFYDLIHQHVDAEFKSQNTYLHHDLIDIERSAQETGTWDSAEYYRELSTYLRDHATRRLDRLYETLFRIVLAHFWELDREINAKVMRILSFYAEQQKEYLGQFLPVRWKDLSMWRKAKEKFLGQNIRRHPGGSEWRDRIDSTIDDLLRRYEQELDLTLIEHQY